MHVIRNDKTYRMHGLVIFQISNRRDMRDAFLRGENAVQSKFDPSHRERTREKDSYEREKDKEKEKVITNGGRAPPPGI